MWINGRTEERVERALTGLRNAVPGGEVRGVAADLGAPAGAERIIAALPTADILVNNLGIYEWKPFDEIPDEDWERFFAVNVMSGVRLTRHYVRGLRERNWGRVIFVSSESGISIPVETVHYGMTKTAQLAISRCRGHGGEPGQGHVDQAAVTSITAWAKSLGASWGRL